MRGLIAHVHINLTPITSKIHYIFNSEYSKEQSQQNVLKNKYGMYNCQNKYFSNTECKDGFVNQFRKE